MLLLNIAAVFVSGMADFLGNILIIQFSVMRGTAMILQKMVLSLMALPTMLRTCYQCLAGVRNLTFSEILKNIEQFMYYLTIQASAEMERREMETQQEYKFILGSIRRLRTAGEEVARHHPYLEPFLYSICCDLWDMIFVFPSFLKAKIMLELATSLSNIVYSSAWTVYIIVRKFENK
ncbi:hypothetical protein TNCV_3891421 [Trichonephila clavipes]|nr:hypothetical protein TNCV_3891421 [Trichonephila clavipes]